MTPKLMIFLAIGTVLMGIPICYAAKKNGVSIWKACIATVLLTVSGAAGTFLMYYIENGKFGGLSFYGAVFLVPAVFSLVSMLLHISYGKITDLCAIGECIMLALMKVHCILGGCCLGRVLYTTADGASVRFPSRETEMIVALVLFSVMLCWMLQKRHSGQLYARYLIMYGVTRFVLNMCREAWVIKEMLLPFGNIWSLVAIGIGILWLYVVQKKRKRKTGFNE